MKRLIKRAEFYESNKDKKWGDYIEIFKNPTSKEVRDTLKVINDIRGLLYRNGDVYIWPSSYLHDDIIYTYGMNVDINEYHFYTEGRNFIKFHVNGVKINYDEFKSALEKALPIISQFVNTNTATVLIINLNIADKTRFETTFDELLNMGNEKVARLITADAYDWVQERAELIRKKNLDMDEGMEYGIAWIQYKKDHPKWKSKKEKNKKKSAARYNELDSKEWDNENIYSDVVNKIESIYNTIENIDNENSDINYIIDSFKSVDEDASEIENLIKTAKENGIFNEDELKRGKDMLVDLEKVLDSLQKQIDNLDNKNYDLEHEIEQVQIQIDDIQSKLSNTASYNGRLKKLGRHQFICHVHDSIKEYAQNIQQISWEAVESLDSSFEDTNESIDKEKIMEFCKKIEDNLTDIQHSINEAQEMNGRMGNGINVKNDTINDLKEQIEKLEDEVKSHDARYSDLERMLNELQQTLYEFENEL